MQLSAHLSVTKQDSPSSLTLSPNTIPLRRTITAERGKLSVVGGWWSRVNIRLRGLARRVRDLIASPDPPLNCLFSPGIDPFTQHPELLGALEQAQRQLAEPGQQSILGVAGKGFVSRHQRAI